MKTDTETQFETYVERAKRLGIDPTVQCIACGSERVERVITDRSRFCQKHLDWESATVVQCTGCNYEVGLACDLWTHRKDIEEVS